MTAATREVIRAAHHLAALLEAAAAVREYSPDQPRVPSGPGGGEWEGVNSVPFTGDPGPSGHMSDRARKAGRERASRELFGPKGLPGPTLPKADEVKALRRQARELRDLANRGMKTRAYSAKAAELEKRAAELESTHVQEAAAPKRGLKHRRHARHVVPARGKVEAVLRAYWARQEAAVLEEIKPRIRAALAAHPPTIKEANVETTQYERDLIREQIRLAEYSPDQPREPAGSPEGGEFAGGASSRSPTTFHSAHGGTILRAEYVPEKELPAMTGNPNNDPFLKELPSMGDEGFGGGRQYHVSFQTHQSAAKWAIQRHGAKDTVGRLSKAIKDTLKAGATRVYVSKGADEKMVVSGRAIDTHFHDRPNF